MNQILDFCLFEIFRSTGVMFNCFKMFYNKLLFFRNEVWRYNGKEFSTHGARLRSLVFRGFKYGAGAFLITILLESAYDKMNPDIHGHGHGGGHH